MVVKLALTPGRTQINWLISLSLIEMETNQAMDKMGRKLAEYQARIEELEKASAAEAQRTAKRVLYRTKRRHDGTSIDPSMSATEGSVGSRQPDLSSEAEAWPSQGTE